MTLPTPAPSRALADYFSRLLTTDRRAYAEAVAAELAGGPPAPLNGMDPDLAARIRLKVQRYTRTQERGPTASRTPTSSATSPSAAQKLRRAADGLEGTLAKLSQVPFAGMNATHRRASFQASRAEQHDRMAALQRLLRILADLHEAGTIPLALAGVTTRPAAELLWRAGAGLRPGQPLRLPQVMLGRAELEELLNWARSHGTAADVDLLTRAKRRFDPDEQAAPVADDQVAPLAALLTRAKKQGFICARWSPLDESLGTWRIRRDADLLTPEQFTEAVNAVREFLTQALTLSPEQQRQRAIEAAERALIGAKIPGYFPTPSALAQQLVDAADILAGHRVLEPSAGKGNLADLIRERHPDATLHVVERHSTLRSLLTLKGHRLVGDDALTHADTYDRIVMNPPFEQRQDVRHVMHAYAQLAPGGRLVAVMSEGPFFGSDAPAVEFRAWLAERGGYAERNPEGSFAVSEAGRSTGVNTRTVILDAPDEMNA